MKKKVKDLQVGDILSSGTKIVERPFDSISTPRGQINLTVEYPNGNRRTRQWGKHTEVDVICPACQFMEHNVKLRTAVDHTCGRTADQIQAWAKYWRDKREHDAGYSVAPSRENYVTDSAFEIAFIQWSDERTQTMPVKPNG